MLRCPQMVLLSEGFLLDLYAGTGGPDVAVVRTAWYDSTGAPESHDTYIWDAVSSVPNWQAVEYARIDPIFRAVAAKIQNVLRPGRTWVDVVDYQTANPLQIPNSNFHWPAGSPNSGVFPWGGGPSMPIICPPPSDIFFGTDFLHICCGTNGIINDSSDGLSSEYYAELKARMFAVFPKFAGYSAKIYGVASLGQQAALPLLAPIPIDSLSYPVRPPIFPVPTGETLDPQEQAYWDLYLINTVADLNVNDANSGLATINTGQNAFNEGVAGDLVECGFSYGGDSTVISSVDYLVALIAAHFNFDPITGQDM